MLLKEKYFKNLYSLIVIGFVLLSLSACSVKEYRVNCGCVLLLNLEQIEQGTDLNLFLTGKNFLKTDRFYVDTHYVHYIVPQSGVVVNCYSGLDSIAKQTFVHKDGSIIIPIGADCPPVYMYNKVLKTNTEIVEDTIILNKNFCNLKINLKYVFNNKEDYMPIVCGNIQGYNKLGLPEEGKFEYTLTNKNSENIVRIPRQKDSSLMLQIGNNKYLAIGEYMAQSGYDWNSASLKDCTLNIEIQLSQIVVKVETWNNKIKLDISI